MEGVSWPRVLPAIMAARLFAKKIPLRLLTYPNTWIFSRTDRVTRTAIACSRTVISPLWMAMATVGCLLGSWSCGDSSASEPPNVLFISIDDLNDWLGCLGGHPQTRTPNLDRLAKRGILFANAHCTAPACNPSRAAVYTGLRPHRTGVWSNKSHKLPGRQGPASLATSTNGGDHLYLPQAFQRNGYRTAGTGKLLHGGGSDQIFQHGFYPEQRWSPLSSQEAAYTAAELPSKGSDHPRHTVTRNAPELESQGALPPLALPLNRMPSDRAPSKKNGRVVRLGANRCRGCGDGRHANHRLVDQTASRDRGAILLGGRLLPSPYSAVGSAAVFRAIHACRHPFASCLGDRPGRSFVCREGVGNGAGHGGRTRYGTAIQPMARSRARLSGMRSLCRQRNRPFTGRARQFTGGS